MRNTHVGHASRAKKGIFPRGGAVNKLIHDHEMSRCHVFLKRTAGTDTDHIGDAKPFERINIGAVRYTTGGMHMTAPVAGEKYYLHTVQRPGE